MKEEEIDNRPPYCRDRNGRERIAGDRMALMQGLLLCRERCDDGVVMYRVGSVVWSMKKRTRGLAKDLPMEAHVEPRRRPLSSSSLLGWTVCWAESA